MAITKLVSFSEFQPTGNTADDMRRMLELVEKELQNIRLKVTPLPEVSVTFTTTDGKTIVVKNGVVISYQ